MISFNIEYKTYFGQQLYVAGSIPELGKWDYSRALPMKYSEGGNWKANIKTLQGTFSYKYILKSPSGILVEVGEPRTISTIGRFGNIVLQDMWQGSSDHSAFLSAPFANVFYRRKSLKSPVESNFVKELVIRVTAPLVQSEDSISICGESDALGNWNPLKALPMRPVSGCRWEVALDASRLPEVVRFKFIKLIGESACIWEACDNRVLEIPVLAKGGSIRYECGVTTFPPRTPRFAGVAVPVFSLRSKEGYGIGDFSDIRKLVDWATITQQSIIQLLPINDTWSTGTWTDSYPYSGISIMALHPIYINPSLVGKVDDIAKLKKFESERRALNALETLDYERVLHLKDAWCRTLFEQNGDSFMEDPGFQEFFEGNREWLLPYAAFCVLRDKYDTADFSRWEKYSIYDRKKVDTLWKNVRSGREMRYYVYLQHHLHLQMLDARDYAHSRGIAIKGDIPIGITPQSVEAWSEPHYFNMDAQAGAPPDDFSVKGQNWGFPTYNWARMAEDGYSWWKRRFTKMAEYFDAYRIDHVLGFFRIWQVPSNQVLGLMGHFNPAMPYSYEDMISRGFDFRYDRHATPFIRYYMLREMFGDRCQMVQETFLDSNELDVFTLKPEFSNQKLIEAWFEGKEDNELKDGIMALAGEVLFVEDPHNFGCFHPRISAQYTYSYQALSEEEKSAFNRLYDEFFYTRHNSFWQEAAMRRLPQLITATNMLTCAEDLGMIPACVPPVLEQLKILTLEIQRMPKEVGVNLGNPAYYPYLSVCATGTHDTSTLRGWWLERYGEDCPSHHCEDIVDSHLNSPAMLTILPLQDWFSLDDSLRVEDPESERINIPSNPKHYWRYRMHLTLEELFAKTQFNSHIAHKVILSGRSER